MEIENEKCNCKFKYPTVLQHNLTENAIVCSNCNLDRVLNLISDLNKEIREWNLAYNKTYKIWLNSDKEIEELDNPLSNLNIKGLQITLKLNAINPSYYWWHINEDKTFSNCPNCDNKLLIVDNSYSDSHKVCNNCRILIND